MKNIIITLLTVIISVIFSTLFTLKWFDTTLDYLATGNKNTRRVIKE